MKDITDVGEFGAYEADLRRRLQDYAGRAVVRPGSWQRLQSRIAVPRGRAAGSRWALIVAVAAVVVILVAAIGTMVRSSRPGGPEIKTVPSSTTTTTSSPDTTTSTTEPDEQNDPTNTTIIPGTTIPTSLGTTIPGTTIPTGRSTGTGGGSSDGGSTDAGSVPDTSTSSTSSTTSTTDPPGRRFRVTASVVAVGQPATAQSIDPCIDESRKTTVLLAIGIDNQLSMFPVPVDVDASGMWTFTDSTGRPAPGEYEMSAVCLPEGTTEILFSYEPVRYTVVSAG